MSDYCACAPLVSLCFFFNDTATTEIYTLSLHDALPISARARRRSPRGRAGPPRARARYRPPRSEEHTSELQSHVNLVCRLLLEKKKKKQLYENLNKYGANTNVQCDAPEQQTLLTGSSRL